MSNITQDFTTPAFADTLKEYGIEIDTLFYWRGIVDITAGYKLCVEPFEYINKEIAIGWLKQSVISDKISLFNKIPAYPLTQVLRWLPKHLTSNNYLHSLTGERIDGNQWWGYGRQDPNTVSGTIAIICFVPLSPIEDLITQGLREGWLTKDIILKNAAL